MSKPQALPAIPFRLLFESSPHPYLVLYPDAVFTIAAVNDRYLVVTGTERAAIVGRGLFDVFPDNPDNHSGTGASDLRASLQRVVRDGVQDIMGIQKYDIPHSGDAAGGFEVRYWSPVNTPVFDAERRIAYIIHHVEDITDFILTREQVSRESAAQIEKVEKRAERMEAEVLRRATEVKDANRQLKTAMEELERREAELARLNTRLQELDHAKTEFFANVSHEFRTPLTLLLGPIEDLLGQSYSLPESTPDNRVLLEIAYRNALRLLKLVNSLLDFSRLEAGRAAPVWKATDLASCTAGLASSFQSLFEQADLELVVDCQPLPQPVEVDRDMWEKIVLNLVSNAFKFTWQGRIDVRLRAVEGDAELTVTDTGVGIPAHELPHIFERFHRVEGAHGRTYEGSGIGLALVQDLVHLHGASIRVASEPGRGSCFTVRIPMGITHNVKNVSTDAAEQAPATSRSLMRAFVEEALQWIPDADAFGIAPHERASAPGRRGRIVVADDNTDMRAYIRRLLEDAGYAVVAVANAQAALAICTASPPDLLLSDIMMPGMDGFALLQHIRAHSNTAGLPVILLSALAGEEARIEGLSSGADDYLIKPFPARELVARVEGMIRLAQARQEAQEATRKLAEEIEDLYDNAPCGYHSLDAEGVITRMNKTELAWIGYSAVELIGVKHFADLLSPVSRDIFEEDFRHLKQEGFFHDREYDLVRRDGSILPVLASASAIRDADGRYVLSRITVFDYTERRRIEESLRQAAAVFSNTNEGIIVADHEQRIVNVNPAFSRITGFELDDVLGRTPHLLQSGRHDKSFYENMTQMLASTGQWQGEIWNRRKDGEIYPAWENISVVRDEHGRINRYVSIFSNISAIKDAQARMAHLAHHDALTGLPNRLLLAANLDRAMEHAKRHGKKIGMFLLDLDRFKLINDTLGHAAGDLLLQTVAQRLQQCVRAEDTVARLGGDEFAIIVNELEEADSAAPLAGKIIQSIAEPLSLPEKEIVTSTSIGISIYPDHASTADDLLKTADAAMYQAKARGRNTYRFYTEEMTSEAASHLALETGLRHALTAGEFELHYQPQIALASGVIVGAEALLRWRHPTRGLLPPDEFIPAAEESGLIEAIGDWVLNAALSQAVNWSSQRLTPLRIAINVSGRQLLYNHMINAIGAAMQRHQPLAKGVTLELEITENMLSSFERCAEAFFHLKGNGMTIAIDDFGTGYSSLSRLKHLAVDTLKIDKAFIRDIPVAADNTSITSAIIAMAHGLGLKVIAEGVEHEEQLAFLRQHDCDEAQGYAISRAVSAQEMTALLLKRIAKPLVYLEH